MEKKEKYNQFESERQAKENLRKYPNESERSLIEKTDGNFNKKFSDNSHNNHNYQEDSLDRIQTDLQGIRTVPVSGALRNRKEKSLPPLRQRVRPRKQPANFLLQRLPESCTASREAETAGSRAWGPLLPSAHLRGLRRALLATHSQQKFCSEDCQRINHNKVTLEFYHRRKEQEVSA